MSSPQGRKSKSESYAYSWFLPAEGHNGSVIVTQVLPSELEAPPNTINPVFTAMEARTEEWRHSGEKAKSAQKSPTFSPTTLRLAGIGGWSAMAATVGVLLPAKLGYFPGFQLGILAVAWAGISAAIWFAPGILSRLLVKGK